MEISVACIDTRYKYWDGRLVFDRCRCPVGLLIQRGRGVYQLLNEQLTQVRHSLEYKISLCIFSEF